MNVEKPRKRKARRSSSKELKRAILAGAADIAEDTTIEQLKTEIRSVDTQSVQQGPKQSMGGVSAWTNDALASDPSRLVSKEATGRGQRTGSAAKAAAVASINTSSSAHLVRDGLAETIAYLRETGLLRQGQVQEPEGPGTAAFSYLNLEYKDEFGRKQSAKDVFKAMSRKFHGTMPGLKRQERRLREGQG